MEPASHRWFAPDFTGISDYGVEMPGWRSSKAVMARYLHA
jgi:hypothetical protein